MSILKFKPILKPKLTILPLKYIDLFCGIGSFHYSFEKLGWTCIMACDINPVSCQTYMANYGQQPLGDICDIDPKQIPYYDILCAGFPCQSFSNIGKHKGFNDERGQMFSQLMKFTKYHQPKVVVLENVPALLSHDNGQTFIKITNELKNEGYVVKHNILRCDEYGIPQMRKRLFIIGIRQDIAITNNLDNLDNLDNSDNLDNLFDYQSFYKNITLSQYLNQDFSKKTAYTIRCGGRHSSIDNKHNWDGYMITVNNVTQEYRLSLDDAKKLQGFPNDFKLSGSNTNQWKQLGNTIPTIFTKLIGHTINKLKFD